jgi:hypothetical protein
MKRLILVGFLFLVQFSFAQKTLVLEDFEDLKVFDKMNVTLIAAKENKVVITGTNQDDVEAIIKKGLLKIKLPLTKTMSGDAIQVILYFKKIKSIDANEGSIVTCDGIFKQNSLDLSTQEGARITVALDVDNTSIKAYSGGIINLSGKATTQTVSINSGGVLKASSLETAQTTVSVTAGGNAEVKANKMVNAKVKAGGFITIYGNPKNVKQSTAMGGSIISK